MSGFERFTSCCCTNQCPQCGVCCQVGCEHRGPAKVQTTSNTLNVVICPGCGATVPPAVMHHCRYGWKITQALDARVSALEADSPEYDRQVAEAEVSARVTLLEARVSELEAIVEDQAGLTEERVRRIVRGEINAAVERIVGQVLSSLVHPPGGNGE